MLLFTSGTMGWFLTRNKWYESAALVLTAFVLFRPGFFLDEIAPPYEAKPAAEMFALAEQGASNASLRVRFKGVSIEGDAIDSTFPDCLSARRRATAPRACPTPPVSISAKGNMSSITSILADRRNSWASILTGRLSRLT